MLRQLNHPNIVQMVAAVEEVAALPGDEYVPAVRCRIS